MHSSGTRRPHTTMINAELYVHDLNLFIDVPGIEIKLFEFEELAIDRMKLFATIERASSKRHKLFSCEWRQCIEDELVKNGLKKYARLMSGVGGQTELDFQARQADHISHYILRLVFNRNEDLRRWFIAREMEWFRIKFIAQSFTSILKFLELNDLQYVPISHEDKDNLHGNLVVCTPNMTDEIVRASDFYRVPFTDVLPLVYEREVFLKNGYAYIPLESLVFCIQHKFENKLKNILKCINENLPRLDDDRLKEVLQNLLGLYSGKQFIIGGNNDELGPADLDELSINNFPLCMRHLHEELRENHHLKHFARLIYGLFLKSIGLQYNDFIQFWRQEFTQIMDQDTFDKKYLYNINHQFGKVGSMVNYDPYSCIKIIAGNVSATEIHGCPFKHFDSSALTAKLKKYGVTTEGINDITALVNNGQYQVACTRYFEDMHLKSPTDTISHPNQYFQESRDAGSDVFDSEDGEK